MEFVNITLVGKQFKYEDPEHYMKTVLAQKFKDEYDHVYYEFGDGAFVGYPLDSIHAKAYGVFEV